MPLPFVLFNKRVPLVTFVLVHVLNYTKAEEEPATFVHSPEYAFVSIHVD
ncbi:hypothetical protein LguiA_026126 [Lonicera macranthoides]